MAGAREAGARDLKAHVSIAEWREMLEQEKERVCFEAVANAP